MDSRLDDLIADWLSYHRELEPQGSLANDRDVGSQYFESIDGLDKMVRTDPESGWQAPSWTNYKAHHAGFRAADHAGDLGGRRT